MVMNKINLYKKKELIRVDILSFDHKGNLTVEYIECKSWTLKISIQLNANWIETEKIPGAYFQLYKDYIHMPCILPWQ